MYAIFVSRMSYFVENVCVVHLPQTTSYFTLLPLKVSQYPEVRRILIPEFVYRDLGSRSSSRSFHVLVVNHGTCTTLYFLDLICISQDRVEHHLSFEQKPKGYRYKNFPCVESVKSMMRRASAVFCLIWSTRRHSGSRFSRTQLERVD